MDCEIVTDGGRTEVGPGSESESEGCLGHDCVLDVVRGMQSVIENGTSTSLLRILRDYECL